MLTLINETEITNHHLENFKDAIASVEDNFDWLIVAHNDEKLIHQLAAVAKNQSVALLQVPQSEWDIKTGELSDAIKWSIKNSNAKNLVIAGHSDATLSNQHSQDSESSELDEECYEQLVDGICTTKEQTENAKVHYAKEMHALFSDTELAKLIAENEISIYALFYLAQSNAFMNFDLSNSSFTPVPV